MLRKLLPIFALGLSATALPLASGCGDSPDAADAAPTIDAAPESGTFSLTWSIVDKGVELPCDGVGADAVSITLVPQGSASGFAEAFPCTSGQGTSRPFAPGVYDMTIDIRASGSRSLLDAPVRVQNVEIVTDTDSPLPAQEFSIAAQGDFHFRVESGATAGNCADVASDGAGIVGFVFALSDSAGACVAADFVIADGSQAGGTYSSDCTTPPAPFACIGSDQEVTVSGVASGDLRLEITGQKAGPIDCFSRVSGFSLAGANLATDLLSLLLTLEYSVECDPNFSPPDGGV